MISSERIVAIFLRHCYVLRNDFLHVFSDFYWPLFDIIVWGLTSVAFQSQGCSGNIGGMIILSLAAWQAANRANGSLFMGIMEEMHAQNIVNLFASPLRIAEYWIGLSLFTFAKSLLVLFLCFGFGYFVFNAPLMLLTWPVIPLLILIIFSGLVIGLITVSILILGGQRAEAIGWITGWFFAPFSGVFCPFEALPVIAQHIGSMVPTSYFFRLFWLIMRGEPTDVSLWFKGIGLLLLYLILTMMFMRFMFNKSKQNGLARLHSD